MPIEKDNQQNQSQQQPIPQNPWGSLEKTKDDLKKVEPNEEEDNRIPKDGNDMDEDENHYDDSVK